MQLKALPESFARLRRRLSVNRFLFLMFLLLFLLYAFFFTSRLLLPGGNQTRLSPLNTPQELGAGRSVSLLRWEYSPSQQRMEVELIFDSASYIDGNAFSFAAASQYVGVEALPVQVVLPDPSCFVVWISEVPGQFDNVSLRILDPDNPDAPLLKLYTNAGEVSTVDRIEERTKPQYLSAQLLRGAEQDQLQIEELLQQAEDCRAKIEGLERRNVQLEEDKQYQVPSEIEETNRRIKENTDTVNALKKQIQGFEDKHRELLLKIEKAKEKANALLNKG